MMYVIGFLGALFLSVILTPLMRSVALRSGVVDDPESDPNRKIHTQRIPLLGGIAVMAAFFVMTAVYVATGDLFSGEPGSLSQRSFWGIIAGAALILLGGLLDDRFNLSARLKFLYPIGAALCIIAGGIGILFVTNPFGGILDLEQWRWTVFIWNGVPYHVVLFADLFTFFWLLGSMFTTKFLDGLDGLVSGVTVIGAVVLFLLSLRADVEQPELALLSAILAGAFLGFLPFNFHPARIFLGEAGSLFAGFILGTLSILAGGKIATALLILGLPILDVAWTILRRLFTGKSPVQGDRRHLHHRLLAAGLSHHRAVLLLYALTAVFGFSTLFVQGTAKAIVLAAIFVVMLLLATLAVYFERRKKTT